MAEPIYFDESVVSGCNIAFQPCVQKQDDTESERSGKRKRKSTTVKKKLSKVLKVNQGIYI